VQNAKVHPTKKRILTMKLMKIHEGLDGGDEGRGCFVFLSVSAPLRGTIKKAVSRRDAETQRKAGLKEFSSWFFMVENASAFVEVFHS